MTAPGDGTVGSILGYLRLDRSDWDREIDAANAKADELGRNSPDVKIRTNSAAAVAQLSAVAAAVRRLQDAQGRENVAQQKLDDLRARGVTSAAKLSAAEENVARAHRATAASLIALAAARAKETAGTDEAARSTAKVEKAAKDATPPVVGLMGALAAIAPAAVPIAAVAGGALIGLAPVAATVMLGIKGIENQMKAGALQGSQFATEVNNLKSSITGLESTAAGGLMSGLTQAMQSSAPLMATINGDVSVLSMQLGNIAAGLAPALLQILTQLNPLFVTFGELLTEGAQHLEHWAQSSTGVSTFVGYVQSVLPEVMNLLGHLLVLFAHLAQAAAPFGSTVVQGLDLLAKALDAIPIGVLQAAIPLAVSLFVALKAYAGINFVVDKVSTAFENLSTKIAASAAVHEAAMLSMRSETAATAAQVAAAKAAEARAAADSAAQIAESTATTNSVLAEGAAAAATHAAEFAAAMQVEADAADAAAIQIAADAQAAAEAADTAGAEAALGWSAMLGPVGAAVVGVGILAGAFLSNGQSAAQAAAQVNTYTDAIKADSGALGENTRAAAANALQKAGAYDDARKLGIGMKEITDLALGNGNIDAFAASLDQYTVGTVGATKSTHDQVAAAKDLLQILRGQSGDVANAVQAYQNMQAALGGATQATTDQSAAAAALYGLTGTAGVQAYQAAAQAAAQATQQAQQQTLQYQLENDAASLLKQTLDALSGKSMSLAQAQNSLDSALVNMGTGSSSSSTSAAKAANTLSAAQARVAAAEARLAQAQGSTKTTSAQLAAAEAALTSARAAASTASLNYSAATTKANMSITGMSAAAVTLRGQLDQQVQAAESVAEAYGNMKGSTEAGRQKLIQLRQQVIDNAVAHGIDRQAVTQYINSILQIPASVPPTKLEIDKAQAEAALKALKLELANLTSQRYTINVAAVAHGGYANVGAVGSGTTVKAMASGGEVTGPGPQGVDSELRLLAPGEFVQSDKAVRMYGLPFMRALNAGRLAMPGLSAPARSAASTPTVVSPAGGSNVTIENFHQTISNPVPEPVSASGPAGLRRAAAAVAWAT